MQLRFQLRRGLREDVLLLERVIVVVIELIKVRRFEVPIGDVAKLGIEQVVGGVQDPQPHEAVVSRISVPDGDPWEAILAGPRPEWGMNRLVFDQCSSLPIAHIPVPAQETSKGATIHLRAVAIPWASLISREVEQRWGDVHVRTHLVDPRSRGNPRPCDHERHTGDVIVDLCLVAGDPELAQVVTMVAPVKDVSVVELPNAASQQGR